MRKYILLLFSQLSIDSKFSYKLTLHKRHCDNLNFFRVYTIFIYNCYHSKKAASVFLTTHHFDIRNRRWGVIIIINNTPELFETPSSSFFRLFETEKTPANFSIFKRSEFGSPTPFAEGRFYGDDFYRLWRIFFKSTNNLMASGEITLPFLFFD